MKPIQAQESTTEVTPLLSDSYHQSDVTNDGPETDGARTDLDTGADNADLEQHLTNGSQKKHEGLPEVQKRLKFIIPALAMGIFLAAADQTIIVSSAGAIGSDLNALSQTNWLATAYFLTLTSFQPLYGTLSNIFGRKACLLWAYVLFGTGAVLCGLAQTMPQLIIARAFAGIGGAGMSTVVSILLSDIVPLRERGTWQGILNIIYSAGASLEAPLGGFLADGIGWRWAFLGQVPICLLAFGAVYKVLNLPDREKTAWRSSVRRIDFLGAAVLIAAVFTLLLALDRGSIVSWTNTVTLIAIGVSVPLFIAFVLVEAKIAKEPVAPGHIMFSRGLLPCYLCNFFAMAGYIAAVFYVSLYFQAVDGVSASGAGLRLIPSILCSVIGSVAGGLIMKKTGKYYRITLVVYILLVAGMTTIFLCSGVLVASTTGIIIGMCISGFTAGFGSTTTLIGIIANASAADQAVATACSYLYRSLGSVVGISVSATVLNQTLRDRLTAELPKLGLGEHEAVDIARQVKERLENLGTLEPRVRAVAVQYYAEGTSATFALQTDLGAGAAISAYFIIGKALSR